MQPSPTDVASAQPIHCAIRGESGPLLLFVHGFRCDHSDWLDLADRLAPHFRCLMPDLPGHGKTPATAQASMAALGAAVNRIRAGFKGEDVILVGHSLGAKVIREAHRQDPQGISGLVLIDGSLYASPPETMRANAAAAVSAGMESFLSNLFGRMFFAPPPDEWLRRVMTRALTGDLDFARRIFLDSVEWDIAHARKTIESIAVPAMVIQTTTFDEQFRWQPLARGMSTELIQTMRRHVHEFTAEIIEGAGHFVMQDAPAQTARLIARFTERIGKAAITPQPDQRRA